MGKKSFIKNAGFYSSASLLTVIASFISFPILTRLFEVGEYGMLGLVTGTIPLLVGLGKAGMQHASIRFYSDIARGKSDWSLKEYFSSLYLFLMFSSTLMLVVWNILVMTIGELIFEDKMLCVLFVISSYLVFTRILESPIVNVLQAQEEAFQQTIYKVVKRFVSLGATIAVLVFYAAELRWYFIALGVTEFALLLYFGMKHVPFQHIRVSSFRPKLVVAMMAFGVPMFGMEFIGGFLNIADRFIINHFLGAVELGKYASAATLVEYGQGIVTTALIASAIPTFLRLNSDKGIETAQRFLANALRIYIWVAVPVIFILASAGQSVLGFLAGAQYAEGAHVMPWIAVGVALFGVFELMGAGLYLSNNTGKMFWIAFVTALANLLLNVIAIPKWGIIGAAVTTAICYFGCIVATYLWSRRYLTIHIPWSSLSKSLLAGASILLVHSLWAPTIPFIDAAYRCVSGLMIYALVIMLLDKTAREELARVLPERLVRSAP